ncbi:MAG: iron-containing alcohol dehydrogenase [Smithellaceae bacterium]|jgi:alcohol dehydrogenase class IV|nr:iron-containing alcohol dehydrogenase [Smithellaceae bacterium]MDD3260107.1 iron-containing alcohol dehydrogenase [Smithellaceae bacterium]MDD3848916.1 iron-containing alcohol dehydrogenase [Smithellaceae bacterium]HOQ72537.1 iron-containing alcohol dehydrogenase [Smithellaceae bacterium]
MIPFRKPLLKTLKASTACFMVLVPSRENVVLEGPGSIRKLPDLMKKQNIQKPLVITDRVLMEKHLPVSLFEAFKAAGMPYMVYDGVQPNPSIENVEEAYGLYVKSNCDAVVGFGGGSSMDCAKVVAGRAVRPHLTAEQLGGYFKIMLPFPKKLPRIIAVPTTAGTGAETTSAAVITDNSRDTKYTVNDFLIHPHVIVLDPELTLGLPPFFTAITAMDALSHAVEGYIGGAHCKFSDAYSEKAVRMIFSHIDRVYKNGGDLEARGQMMLASYYAGIVLNRALTGYVHPFAHKIGGMYHLPHGRVIGAVMPPVFEFYNETVSRRLGRLADVIGASKPGMSLHQKAAAFIASIRGFNRAYGIGETIPELREADFPEIAESVHGECVPYPVPRIMDDGDIFRILKALKG